MRVSADEGLQGSSHKKTTTGSVLWKGVAYCEGSGGCWEQAEAELGTN